MKLCGVDEAGSGWDVDVSGVLDLGFALKHHRTYMKGDYNRVVVTPLIRRLIMFPDRNL